MGKERREDRSGCSFCPGFAPCRMLNNSVSDEQPVRAQMYGSVADGLVGMQTDVQGRPVLHLNATQTIDAASFNIRDLTASDAAVMTATDFDIRNLDGTRDSVTTVNNPFAVTNNTVTLVLGGSTVLTVDTSPYSRSIFLVRADAVSLLTTVNLQLAPINSANYFTTVATETGLILGGEYLLLPTVQMKFARIYATGIGSVLTAYFVGQV